MNYKPLILTWNILGWVNTYFFHQQKPKSLWFSKKKHHNLPFKDPVLLSIHHTSFHDTQQTRWEDLGFAPVELPPEPQPDAQQRATKLRRRQVAVNFSRIWGRLKEGGLVGWFVGTGSSLFVVLSCFFWGGGGGW